MLNVYESVDGNKRRSTVIVIFFSVFIAVVAYILGRALGYGNSFIGVALIISGITSFLSYWYSDKIILSISRARPASKKEDFNLFTVCENLSISLQIPMPKLYVIDDSAPNAFATGRDIDHAVICATTGLLSKLDRTELEGVIAHEMSHIRNYDMRLMSIVSVMVGMIVLLSDWLLRSNIRRRNNDDNNQFGAILMIVGLILAILSPLIAQIIQLSISRRREFLADASSVLITRQPSGLIRALKKISSDTEPLEVANRATAHMYIVNPLKGKEGIGSFAKLFNTHPPIKERIAALEKMK